MSLVAAVAGCCWLFIPHDHNIWIHDGHRVAPIFGPLTAAEPSEVTDEPSDEEVMMAFEQLRPLRDGIPQNSQRERKNLRIVKKKLCDYVDPPRMYPLIGAAQLHHVHYKCAVEFTEITSAGTQSGATTHVDEICAAVYVDHNHFHMMDKKSLERVKSGHPWQPPESDN